MRTYFQDSKRTIRSLKPHLLDNHGHTPNVYVTMYYRGSSHNKLLANMVLAPVRFWFLIKNIHINSSLLYTFPRGFKSWLYSSHSAIFCTAQIFSGRIMHVVQGFSVCIMYIGYILQNCFRELEDWKRFKYQDILLMIAGDV